MSSCVLRYISKKNELFKWPNRQSLSSNLAVTKGRLNAVQLWFCGVVTSVLTAVAFSRFSLVCTVAGSDLFPSVECGQGMAGC